PTQPESRPPPPTAAAFPLFSLPNSRSSSINARHFPACLQSLPPINPHSIRRPNPHKRQQA
ncbi:hypothetical protein, partial [Neisseria elongata]